jgi:putative ABC transport system ATP-binding protein
VVTKPWLLLADEPTGNLDSARKMEILELLVDLNRERGITVVMVTHERDMAVRASRVVSFHDGLVERDDRRGAPG